jgi:hypothetical protein
MTDKAKSECRLPACCTERLPGFSGWPSGTPEREMTLAEASGMAAANARRLALVRPIPAGHSVTSRKSPKKV